MKRILLAAVASFALISGANAASLTLPSVTVTGQTASTSISCTPYPTLTAPVAAGTLLTSCTVSPSNWTGAVSISGTQFIVSSLTGNTFNVSVGAAPLAAGTYNPGTLTSVP